MQQNQQAPIFGTHRVLRTSRRARSAPRSAQASCDGTGGEQQRNCGFKKRADLRHFTVRRIVVHAERAWVVLEQGQVFLITGARHDYSISQFDLPSRVGLGSHNMYTSSYHLLTVNTYGMPNKRIILITLLFSFFLPKPGLSLDIYQRAHQAMEYNSAALIRWQSSLYELVKTEKSSFSAVASIQRDLQLNLISMRSQRFTYLLQNDPQRLVFEKGIARLSNFDWTADDDRELSLQSPSYANQEKYNAELVRRNKTQSNWPEFRKFFREKLSKTPEYQKLLEELLVAQKTASEMLGRFPLE